MNQQVIPPTFNTYIFVCEWYQNVEKETNTVKTYSLAYIFFFIIAFNEI